MIYVFLLAIILYGVYRYDFLNKGKNKYALFLYIFVLLVCVSAFKYRVGSDILAYMSEYDDYLSLGSLSLDYVFDNSNRQPGWLLLMAGLKSISASFFVFQLIQAVFINSIIARTIYQNTKYVFTAILFYAIYLYTELNFEVMRESFAVGFFLLSLEAYRKNSWLKYYTLAILAFSFHLSAVFLFVLPLVKLLPVGRNAVMIYLILLCLLFFFFLPSLHEALKDIPLEGALGEKSTAYLDNQNYQVEWGVAFLIKSFVILSISYWVAIIKGHDSHNQKYLLQLGIVYFLFEALNVGVPFFYRFNNYILLIYLLLLSKSIYTIIDNRFLSRYRGFSLILLLCAFIYLPLNTYFVATDYRNVPVYRKYYPYYTIFSKEKDQLRERAF